MLLGIDVESFKALLPRTAEMPKQHREKCGSADVIGYPGEKIYIYFIK